MDEITAVGTEKKRVEKKNRKYRASRAPREEGCRAQRAVGLTFSRKQGIISCEGKEIVVAENDGKKSRPGRNGGTITPLVAGDEYTRQCARLGGIACGEAKRKKKLVSQIIAEYLAREHEVPLYNPTTGKVERKAMSTDDLIEYSVTNVLARGDAASSSMIKTLAEVNEGKTVNLPGLTLDLSPEERARRIRELEEKRDSLSRKKKTKS